MIPPPLIYEREVVYIPGPSGMGISNYVVELVKSKKKKQK